MSISSGCGLLEPAKCLSSRKLPLKTYPGVLATVTPLGFVACSARPWDLRHPIIGDGFANRRRSEPYLHIVVSCRLHSRRLKKGRNRPCRGEPATNESARRSRRRLFELPFPKRRNADVERHIGAAAFVNASGQCGPARGVESRVCMELRRPTSLNWGPRRCPI